jgi:hypothetical protein
MGDHPSNFVNYDMPDSWYPKNMVPVNPHCFHSPGRARTPSPSTFFSGNYPNAGIYQKIYKGLKMGENPWVKTETTVPPMTDDGITVIEGSPVNQTSTMGTVAKDDGNESNVITINDSPPVATTITQNDSDAGDFVVKGDDGDDDSKFKTPDRKPSIPFNSPKGEDLDHSINTTMATKGDKSSEAAKTNNSSMSLAYSSNTSCSTGSEGLPLGQSGVKKASQDDDLLTPEKSIDWKKAVDFSVPTGHQNQYGSQRTKMTKKKSRSHPFFK